VKENGTERHVLVKFSPAVTTPEGERWSDLPVCEHLALEVIRGAGLSASHSVLHSDASLIPTDDQLTRFRLAPAYDMLPMLYRPLNGETPLPEFAPPAPAPLREWSDAHQLALSFWALAAEDGRISATFRDVCAGNRTRLMQTAAGPRLAS